MYRTCFRFAFKINPDAASTMGYECCICYVLRIVYRKIRAYLAHEGLVEADDIPQTKDPVWILGKKYNGYEDVDSIREDITSKIWCTYRRGFVPIGGGDGLTTDKGWGCMLRCGQMVLAQALVTIHLGRDFVWEPTNSDSVYLKLVQKFEDKRQAPYSIHQIALMGASEGKSIGEWFGPNTVAQVLKKLAVYDEDNALAIHVALDNIVIVDEIKNLCLAECKTKWKPLLLIVPLRLGLANINPIYVPGLKACFRFKNSLGIVGGKPNLALYFIGCVNDEVIYLDPHTTQRAGSVGGKVTDEEIEMDKSYHCKHASRMNILSMDPSVAVCFLCETQNDFYELCYQIKRELVTSDKHPLFEICEETPKQWEPPLEDSCEEALGAAALSPNSVLSDLDEFEIL